MQPPWGSGLKAEKVEFGEAATVESVRCYFDSYRKEEPVPGLHLDFARTKQIVQLNGLFREDGLRRMMEKTSCHAVKFVFPFVASTIDRSPGLVERCDLARVNVTSMNMVNKLIFDHSAVA